MNTESKFCPKSVVRIVSRQLAGRSGKRGLIRVGEEILSSSYNPGRPYPAPCSLDTVYSFRNDKFGLSMELTILLRLLPT